jgi:hypothetical protein
MTVTFSFRPYSVATHFHFYFYRAFFVFLLNVFLHTYVIKENFGFGSAFLYNFAII